MKKEKGSSNLVGWCMIHASKLKMNKGSTDAKCAKFWRERENAEARFL